MFDSSRSINSGIHESMFLVVSMEGDSVHAVCKPIATAIVEWIIYQSRHRGNHLVSVAFSLGLYDHKNTAHKPPRRNRWRTFYVWIRKMVRGKQSDKEHHWAGINGAWRRTCVREGAIFLYIHVMFVDACTCACVTAASRQHREGEPAKRIGWDIGFGWLVSVQLSSVVNWWYRTIVLQIIPDNRDGSTPWSCCARDNRSSYIMFKVYIMICTIWIYAILLVLTTDGCACQLKRLLISAVFSYLLLFICSHLDNIVYIGCKAYRTA